MALVLMTLDDREILVEAGSPMEAKCLDLGYEPETLPSLDEARKAVDETPPAAEKKAAEAAKAAGGQQQTGNPNRRPHGRR